LNANPGYVQGLLVQQQSTATAAKDAIAPKTVAASGESVEETPANDDDRRTGDMSVYLYYANAVGVARTITFVLLLGVYVFFLSYPGI
jgi:hypothetical protein